MSTISTMLHLYFYKCLEKCEQNNMTISPKKHEKPHISQTVLCTIKDMQFKGRAEALALLILSLE